MRVQFLGTARKIFIPAIALLLLTVNFSSAEQVARLSVHWSAKHHCAKHAQIFADRVNERAKGKLKIEVYPSKQLFGIREVMGAVTSGAVELGGIVGVVSVSFPPINKNFNIASYPGLFQSYDEQRNFFQDSPEGKKIWNEITTKTNSKLIMYNPVGPVMTFSSKRELTGIDAMKDLKARRLLKSEEPMWDAFGSKRVSLPTGEVYTALQTGMIYAQKPYQYYADAFVMANAQWFDSLTPELQKIILEVGKEVGDLSTNGIMDAGEDTLKKFQEKGGIITVLSGAEKAKFDKLMNEKVIPAMADMIDANALKAAEDYVASLN